MSKTHQRIVYNLLDLLGELGGLVYLALLVLGLLMMPLSKFSFTLKAAQMLFYGRTYDNKLFTKGYDEKTKKFLDSGFLSNMERGEIEGHWPISISIL